MYTSASATNSVFLVTEAGDYRFCCPSQLKHSLMFRKDSMHKVYVCLPIEDLVKYSNRMQVSSQKGNEWKVSRAPALTRQCQ